MGANAFVRARINEQLKDEAAAVLADMGLTVSDVVRITLTRIAREKALPFDMKLPNSQTKAAMAEAEDIIAHRSSRFSSGEDLIDGLEGERRGD